MSKAAPVFIVGSPRSGTTLFRDLLRQDSIFLCPEETHFFRWNEPYASSYYFDYITNNPTLIYHRELDGVSQETFSGILEQSADKRELLNNYMGFLAYARNLSDSVIYVDKTPQHVYALNLIRSCFPDLRVIHIVRNPLNVVSSLMMGRQFEKQSLVGALNFWLEAVNLAREYSKDIPSGYLEVNYDALVRSPQAEMNRVYTFLNVNPTHIFDFSNVRVENDRYRDFLSPEQIDYILGRSKDAGYKIAQFSK